MAALAGVLLVAPLAQAQVSTRDQRDARRLFEAGVALVEQGDLAGAVEKFRASYDLNPRAVVLFNIGALQQEMGDAQGALDSFRRYLDEGGEEVEPERRVQVEQLIRDIEAQLTYVQIVVNEAGAAVSIDGRPVGLSPLLQPIRVDPGVVEVRVRKDGFDEAVTVVPVPEAQTTPINVTLIAAGGGPVEPPIEGPIEGPGDGTDGGTVEWWQEWWFWTAVGAVVVGVSLGAGLGAWAAADEGESSATWSVWGR